MAKFCKSRDYLEAVLKVSDILVTGSYHSMILGIDPERSDAEGKDRHNFANDKTKAMNVYDVRFQDKVILTFLLATR